MRVWNHFQRTVCLTVDEAEWAIAQAEFARVGLSDVRKFQAVPSIGPHESFNLSERQILTEFLESEAETLLHLEEDCVFLPEVEILSSARAALPRSWDIVYLGANVRDESPERVSCNLFRIRDAWTTHAVGYNRKVVPFLLDNMPGPSVVMFDTWLGQQLPHLNAYIVAPMVAYQRPRASAIWGTFEDYTPIFDASNEKLR